MKRQINFKDFNNTGDSVIYFKNKDGRIIDALYSSNAFTTYMGTAGFLNIINTALKDGLNSVNEKGFDDVLNKCIKKFVDDFDHVINKFNLDTTPNFRLMSNPTEDEMIAESPDFQTIVNGETGFVDFSDYVLADNLQQFRKNVASPLHEATGQVSAIALISSDNLDLTHIPFDGYNTIVSELLDNLDPSESSIDFLEFEDISNKKHAFVQN